MAYYTNVNSDLLARVPLDAQNLLEIGCGAGNFAQAFRARQPLARYVGVELFEAAAQAAGRIVDRIVCGDIERADALAELDGIGEGRAYDTLLFGDVLEHLRDPWLVLADLRTRMTDGGVCVACIPNVGHWSLVEQQLKGRWDYSNTGLLDRTHLRFFTLETAIELFRTAGWQFLDAYPRIIQPEQTAEAIRKFLPLADALGVAPQKLQRDLSAFQWVIRAVNGAAPSRTHVVGLGLPKRAGVTEARVDHPLAALSSLVRGRAVWGSGNLAIPADFRPGVFVSHRKFMNEPVFNGQVDNLIAKGWTIVSEIDDDPHHWAGYVESDFRAFRGVHAVTVSTEPLADMIRQWNPNVQVFPNAIFELPQVPASTPKQGARLRIFFGALNRGKDWAVVQEGILSAAATLGDRVEFVVVHERAIFDSLPDDIIKEFHPTLPHDAYMALLASCDVGLLPLEDTPFNRLKSDLKFIECCAAGVVPICSPPVYAKRPEHHAIGEFANSSNEWRNAIEKLCGAPELIAARRASGLDYVKGSRMHCHQVDERERYYRSLIARHAELEVQRQIRLAAAKPVVSIPA